jgi:hypothetical protein
MPRNIGRGGKVRPAEDKLPRQWAALSYTSAFTAWEANSNVYETFSCSANFNYSGDVFV